MEAKKCSNCGATLERVKVSNVWVCPFCNVKYEDDPSNEKEKKKRKKYGLRDDLFIVEADLKESMKRKRVAECIKSMAYCMDNYDTAKDLEEYILNKMTLPDDVFVKGVNDDRIQEVLPTVENVKDVDERLIFCVNTGILSHGKDYYVITDKRSIFVDNKNVKAAYHKDIGSLKLGDSFGAVNWYINGDYDKCLMAVSQDGQFHGALIALICMLSFEQDPKSEKIKIIG